MWSFETMEPFRPLPMGTFRGIKSLEKQVKKYSKGKKVLDLGTGSGIQARAAIKNKARSVLASDINQEVIKHCKNLGINCIKSNLFNKIKGKFDLIIFNPPYLPYDGREDKESKKVTTGGKKGDELILKFLKKGKKHLGKKGVFLIVLSSLTPRNRINELLKKENMRKKVLSKKKLFMETLEVWEIKRLKSL